MMGSIYHEMNEDELNRNLEEVRSEIRELRFTFAVARTLQDPARVRKLKKSVAAIMTVKRERELGIAAVKPKTERKVKASSSKKKEAKSKA